MPGSLEEERRLRDRPPATRTADEVGVVAHRVVEEDLVEHRVAGHLAQRPDRDARLVEVEREPRDAGVLRHREVGAGEQHPVVALASHAAPHLLAVDDPTVAVALGARREPGEIRARAGLAEQLAPVDLALEDRWDEARDLIGRAVREDGRRGHQQAETAGRAQRAELREGGAHRVRCGAVQAAATLLHREVRRGPSGATDDPPPLVDR